MRWDSPGLSTELHFVNLKPLPCRIVEGAKILDGVDGVCNVIGISAIFIQFQGFLQLSFSPVKFIQDCKIEAQCVVSEGFFLLGVVDVHGLLYSLVVLAAQRHEIPHRLRSSEERICV